MKKQGWYDKKCPPPLELKAQLGEVRKAWNEMVQFLRGSSLWIFRVAGRCLPVLGGS